MGYTTTFEGKLTFNKPVDEYMTNFINNFARIRHMKRSNKKIKETFPDYKNLCFRENLGNEGEYFVGGQGEFGDIPDDSVIQYSIPGGQCPGLWCQWIIKDNTLQWDGEEKFYKYVEWLHYLIENFFEPEGYILNGIFEYQGEDEDDHGYITVYNNMITAT